MKPSVCVLGWALFIQWFFVNLCGCHCYIRCKLKHKNGIFFSRDLSIYSIMCVWLVFCSTLFFMRDFFYFIYIFSLYSLFLFLKPTNFILVTPMYAVVFFCIGWIYVSVCGARQNVFSSCLESRYILWRHILIR